MRARPGAGRARPASRAAAQEHGAVTLSKMCGSGMKAAMFAYDMLLAGRTK